MITNPARRFAVAAIAAAGIAGLLAAGGGAAEDASDRLPALGDGDARYSPEKKRELGSTWLRLFRASGEINSDPLLYDYLLHLLYGLAEYSQLRDPELTLVVVQNRRFNAFAVPGNVIGVHDGLLRFSQTESELASVLAHELAHLSQNHFERGRERLAGSQRIGWFGLLAGIALLGAGGDSNAGLAAIAASQAAVADKQLSYARRFEQEADRIAIATLARAGHDPRAVPEMFERLQQASRFDRELPAFLRTHPVTSDRISDARNRAAQHTRAARSEERRTKGDDFLLMRARALRTQQSDPVRAVAALRAELRQATTRGARRAARYGLALALMDIGETRDARAELAPLLAESPIHIPFVVAQAEVAIKEGNYGLATSLLAGHLALNPGNHPLTMTYADSLLATGNARHAARAASRLSRHALRHPQLPSVWRRLASAAARSGNALDSHRAQGEYFMLIGALDRAGKQFEYALKRTDSVSTTAKIRQRVKVLREYRQQQERMVSGKS